ncbi:MAG TPA: MASE1 domain-containing protein [Cytophagaceae bacterium]|jgi:signal transduction histidine kinase|nr:MASE1 domain-containing protein [Cytophagaceae bacterium]
MKLRGVYRYFFLIFSIAFIYFIFAKFGLHYAVVNNHVTLIWPPSGIAFACLFIFGYRIIPALVLGAFFTNIFPGEYWTFATLTSIGNPGEAIAACYLLQIFNFNSRIVTVKDVLMLYFIAMLACGIAPTLGVLGLCLSGEISYDVYWNAWYKWWTGDTMGIIIFAPAILTVYSHFYTLRIEKKFIVEIIAYMFLLSAISIIIFYDLLPNFSNDPLTFILMPFMIYAALRFGQPFTAISALLIAFIAIIATTVQQGPFVQTSVNNSVFLIYGFISVVALTGMILAATNTQLKHSNEELQKFAYIASHNLKSPVNNIASLLSLYDKQATNPAVNQPLIEKIETSVSYLKEVLNDLMMIVTRKQGAEELKKPVNLQEVLLSIKKSIETQIKESQTEFVEDFSKIQIVNYPPAIIHSILLNLITNAIKYKHPARPLLIKIKTFYENRYMCLSVEDNGSGIDLEKSEKDLFGLYKRFHVGIKGKGLGLYMLKSQVEALGGEIKVKSEVGVGSEFIIYLCHS